MAESESAETFATDEPTLEFDHNVIEHLGIKLYQNKPANVLAELVSNSWDADAEVVYIDLVDNADAPSRVVSVSDGGSGMSLNDIKTRYLVIGKQKRTLANERSKVLKRAPMGRKGIGKLAPFGIASRIDVASLADGKLNWFTLELDKLQKLALEKKYKPDFQIKDGDIAALEGMPSDNFRDLILANFRKVAGQSGTVILMSGLSVNSLPDRAEILAKLASRFTVILARDDFKVFINDERIEQADALPEFEFRIPEISSPYMVEKIGDKEVRYWAGFFKTAEKTTDESGVGVYAHGKIAQDRPFYFQSTGKEVFQRYLYAVVEADWLDDLEDDLISTDRTSINWEHEDATALAAWGKSKVSEWLNAYDKHRKGMSASETAATATKMRTEKKILNFSAPENAAIDKLVAEATGGLAKSQAEKAREDLLQAVTKAWANQPTRELIKQLWDGFSKAGASAEAFELTLKTLDENSVPESMGLALTFAQRAYALTVLTKLVNERSEDNLQELIEEFPWIVEPNGIVLTADLTLKTTINRLADEFDETNKYDPLAEIKTFNPKTRADFVFLSDPEKRKIRIVELKAPAGDTLQRYHETQLVTYINAIKSIHNSAKVTGTLIGNRGNGPSQFEPENVNVIVKSWDEILLECRSIYIDMLAAMMIKADVDTEDGRIGLIKEFAGEEVWTMLGRISEKDAHLKSVMARLNHLTVVKAPKDDV